MVEKVLHLKQFLQSMKTDLDALYIALKDPRTPWYAKAIAALVVAYALSPIDFIPDFVPVLGYLDDLLIVHLGALAVIKMIPKNLMAEFRTTSALRPSPVFIWVGTGIVLATWVLVAVLLGWWGAATLFGKALLSYKVAGEI